MDSATLIRSSCSEFGLVDMNHVCRLLLPLCCLVLAAAWPGLRAKSVQPIGPMCTVGAHNAKRGACPNMPQPDPPANSTRAQTHVWPEAFIVDWDMYFIPNISLRIPTRLISRSVLHAGSAGARACVDVPNLLQLSAGGRATCRYLGSS